MSSNFLEKHPLYKECLEVLQTTMVTDHEANSITESFKEKLSYYSLGQN